MVAKSSCADAIVPLRYDSTSTRGNFDILDEFCSNAPALMHRRLFLHAAGSLLLGCGKGASTESLADAGSDAAADASTDATTSLVSDASTDAATDASLDAVAEDAGISEEDARKAQREEFPAWDGRRDSASPVTMLMFRGNLRRNFHGTGSLPNEPVLKWKHRMSALEISKAGEGTRFGPAPAGLVKL
jgi:hypothetical protein